MGRMTETDPAASVAVLPGPLALGLDAGGTQTRWALVDADGALRARGSGAAITGLMLGSDEGRAQLDAALRGIAAQVAQQQPGARIAAVKGGLTGFDGDALAALRAVAAPALGVAPAAVQACSDIELACRAAFAPGQGLVVYAGTGSAAAFVAADGRLHRAGGHGVVIDDAGGGYWLARRALRAVWRAEDAEPGSAEKMPLGRALFARIGSSSWPATRQWVYGASRGELGTLAVAVGEAAAQGDETALALLRKAGVELARLARVLHRRLQAQGLAGPELPVATAGRVFALHPLVGDTLRAVLPPTTPLRCAEVDTALAAARLAAGALA